MADLKDILFEDESSLRKALMFSKGLTIGTVKNVAEGVGHQAANAAQAVSGVQVPYATNPVPQDLGERGHQLLDALTLGMAGATERHYNEITSEAPPANIDEKVTAVLKAMGQTALMDVLPGNELQQLMSGQLNAEQTGEAVGMGILKFAPVGELVGKAQANAGGITIGGIKTLGQVEKRFLNKVWSEGELRRVEDRINNPLSTDAGPALRPAGQYDPNLLSVQGQIAKMSDAELASIIPDSHGLEGKVALDEIAKIRDAGLGSDVRTATLERMVRDGVPYTAARSVAETILQFDKGAKLGDIDLQTSIDPVGRLARDWAVKYDIPLEDVPNAMAGAYLRTANYHASGLAEFAADTEKVFGRVLLDANGKGPKAEAALRQLEALAKLRLASQDASPWVKGVSFINNKVESFRRGMMVSQIATTFRNIQAQGANSIIQIAESALGDTLQTINGKLKGSQNPISNYYMDTLSDFNALVSRFKGSERNNLNQFLNSFPLVKQQLENASTFDLGNTVLANVMRARNATGDLAKAFEISGPKGVGDMFSLARDFMTMHNHLQEMEFRRFFFQGRLDANLKRLGIDSYKDIMQQVRSEPELQPGIKTAIADATEHALKQTFSYTPEGGVQGAILNLYQKLPGSYALLPPFPRFLMNQYRWQIEHSPTIWFNMFEKGFRDKLAAGSAGDLSTADAYRALGKATTGMMLMNGAWVLRNMPEIAGPKYYQFKDPGLKSDDPNAEAFEDVRSMQPFSGFLALADWIKSVKDGRPMNLSANEKLDALVGIRRLSETALFALPDIMRAADSDDPHALDKAMHTVEGQYFASFFTPLHMLRETAAAVAPNSSFGVLRDVQNQELTGPTRSVIPGDTVGMGSLPVRYDPFTGKPQTPEHPLARQFMGVTAKDLTHFERMIYETHGIKISDLTGEYGDPIANNLVAKHVGLQLTSRLEDGSTIGDQLTGIVKNAGLDHETRQLLVQKIIESLHHSAYQAAVAENPHAFLQHMVESKVPAVFREDVRNKMKRSGF